MKYVAYVNKNLPKIILVVFASKSLTIYKKTTHLKQSKTFRLGKNIINNLRGVLDTKKFRNGGWKFRSEPPAPSTPATTIDSPLQDPRLFFGQGQIKSKRRFKWVWSGKDK